MKSQTLTCPKGCCQINIEPYLPNPANKIRRPRRKAGVVVYDPVTTRVLLVQSRGHLWGPPKGTLNYGEHEQHCAVRELKEETGLDIHPDQFIGGTNIKNRAIYYYTERPTCEVAVQTQDTANDANGIAWFRLECLVDCIECGHVALTQHCRVALHRLLGVDLPASTFIRVKSKRR